jgi:transposase
MTVASLTASSGSCDPGHRGAICPKRSVPTPLATTALFAGVEQHRTRHLFIRQQTSVINAIRAHLAEFGIVAPIGRHGVEQLLGIVSDANDKRLPDVARACVAALGAHLQRLKVQILEFDRMIRAWHRSSEASRRLDDIPGVGPALATALVASVADPKMFRSGRDFSAWIGLVPKQSSSGGKDRLGNISKRGDRYLRSLFTTGALAVIRYAKITLRRSWQPIAQGHSGRMAHLCRGTVSTLCCESSFPHLGSLNSARD